MARMTFPYTPTRGVLAGQTFHSRAEYNAARMATNPLLTDAEPSRQPAAARRPALKYSKGMVEAVVKMLSGVVGFLPLFRGDNGITAQETKWLVDDWYDFGRSHPFFANLVVRLFSVDTYGKLVLDHVVIVGARLAASGTLPPATVLPIQLAYVTRQAMDGQIDVAVEAEPTPDIPVATGGTPGPDRSDRDRQDLPRTSLTDAA
jgi:hypothetical protein